MYGLTQTPLKQQIVNISTKSCNEILYVAWKLSFDHPIFVKQNKECLGLPDIFEVTNINMTK